MNVGRLSLDNLEKYGEYTSLHYLGQEFTNRQRLDWAAALATVLRDRGVGVDDKVVVMMPNSPEVISAFQAVWKLGAVIIPVTPQLGPREVRYMLEDSGAQTVITSPPLLPVLAEATRGVDGFRQLLVCGPAAAEGAVDVTAEVEAALAADGRLPLDHLEPREDDDLALLLYTSGTTGAPKGVMLTHGNLDSNARASYELMKDAVAPQERGLHVLPLSHSFGVLMMNIGYLFGSVSVLLPFFEIEAVFEHLANYRIQRFAVVPTMLTYMLNYPERGRYDLGALTDVNSGGAALPNEVRTAFEKEFDCTVKEGYGLSECAPTATSYGPDDDYRPGSVGRAIPGVEVTIRDDDDRELAVGETGEICIRGPNVMQGYWNKPEATAEALVDGWLRSGDVGRMDEDGFVYITDRKKELIIKGGENISPREIEEALHEHPAVAEAAVVGVPHEKYGEDLVAAVVFKPDRDATDDELREHLAGYVTKFKLPSTYHRFEDLPKGGTGKILKRAVKEQILER